MRLALALLTLLALAAPALAHLDPLNYGIPSCPDDGAPHWHSGGFESCTSLPSVCPAGPAVCTPYLCLYGTDYGAGGLCGGLPLSGRWCADDGDVHVYLFSLVSCVSIPSSCPLGSLVCVPYTCYRIEDYVIVPALWQTIHPC